MAGAAEPRRAAGRLLAKRVAAKPALIIGLPVPAQRGLHALGGSPAVIALALAGAALAAHFTLWGSTAPWGRAGAVGALVATAGVSWALWAAALFRQAGTPIRPTNTPLQLIEEGPYRIGRNPMYLGITALLLGAALGLGVPLLAAAALLFAGVVHTVHIPREEALLAGRFGGWYRDYASTTRRWL